MATIIILSVFSSSANNIEPLNQYNLRCYSVEEGLPQNSITDIAINTDGQLLIATYSGIVTFDGKRFSSFIPGTIENFPAVEAFSLAVSQQGIIWIGTTSSGLYKITGKTIENWNIHNGLKSQLIYKIIPIHDSVLFNNDGKAALLKDFEKTSIQYLDSKKINNSFLSTFENINKRLLITGNNSEDTKHQIISSDTSELLNHLQASNGSFYYSENGQVFTIKQGKKIKIIDELKKDTPVSITKMMLSSDNQLWIATATNGLFRYSELGIEAYDLLPNNRLSSLVEDEDGAIWIGTSGGLCMLKRGAIRNIGMLQGLLKENIHALGIDKKNNIYPIPYGKTSTITQINKNTIHNSNLHFENATDVVINAVKEDNNQVWVATNQYIGELKDLKVTPHIHVDGQMRGFLVKDETFWYQYNNELIKQEKTQKTSIKLDNRDSIDIKSLSFAINGDVLVAEENQPYRITNDKAIKIDVPVEATSCIYEFLPGEFWICGGGLWLRKNNINHHFTKEHGLTDVINGHIHDVVNDKHNNIWAISNSGLFRLLRQDLNDYLSGKKQNIKFVKFSEKDGMKSSEFNGSSHGAISSNDDKLWFASQGGVVQVDPDLALFNSQKILNPYVEKLFIGDHLVAPDQWTNIAPNPKAIQIYFGAVFLSEAKNISYRYKLLPHQQTWQMGDIAHFPELNPGHYQLLLQARYHHNDWSNTFIKEMHVLPAWYQTWWFRILAALIIVLLTFALPIWRIQRLKHHKTILKNLVAEKTESLMLANEKLDQMTRIDELTGISNRRDFIKKIEDICQQPDRKVALMLIDIDDFKAYNDYYGHLKGDECLVKVAKVLDHFTSENCMVARFGGEEFVMLFNDIELDQAEIIARNMYKKLHQTQIKHERSSASNIVTLSSGLVMRRTGENTKNVIDRADMVMYKAKSAGKNNIIVE